MTDYLVTITYYNKTSSSAPSEETFSVVRKANSSSMAISVVSSLFGSLSNSTYDSSVSSDIKIPRLRIVSVVATELS